MEVKTIRDNPTTRWFVLILLVTLTFSTYWFNDFFSGLKPLMESSGFGIDSAQFGSILSWTTFANVVGMIIIGGILLDKFGTRTIGPIFAGLATFGAILVAVGAGKYFSNDTSTNIYLMKVGRLFFGLGLEMVCP